jgi:3-hydroxybutyryl-CoA dehydratase
MSDLRQRAIEGPQAGDRFTITRTFTRQDTERFGALTRDYNPVHYEPEFAAAKGFPELILHGLLTGSMICEIGGQLAWLASSMKFEFVRPVLFGDTVTCVVTIDAVDRDGHAEATALFTNQDGQTVVEAALAGQLPRVDDRKVLAVIVGRGDPTNALRDGHRDGDPAGVRIRPAVHADVPALVALTHRTISASYRSVLGDAGVDGYLASGEVERFVEHGLGSTRTLVVEGDVAGYAVAKGPLIELMMVDAPFHRQGLGTLLLHHMEHWLFPAHETLSLESFAGNDPANQFYRNNGWIESGELPDGAAGGPKVLFRKQRGGGD